MLSVLPKGSTVLMSFLVISPFLMVARMPPPLVTAASTLVPVLACAPNQRIGDEVTQIGLMGPDIALHAVQLHLGLCEYGAVVIVDLLLDGGSSGSHVLILGSHALGRSAHSRDLALGADGHNANAGQLGAGGREEGAVDLAVLVGHFGNVLHGGVGVSVNEHVDTVHNIQQVRGTVANGFLVDAQMAQADDVIAPSAFRESTCACAQSNMDLSPRMVTPLIFSRVCLGCRLRGLQTEHADLGRRTA